MVNLALPDGHQLESVGLLTVVNVEMTDPGPELLERRLAEPLNLLIGPEGGLSERDLETAAGAGFTRARLGPRIMRVETAAISACALAQAYWGDLR